MSRWPYVVLLLATGCLYWGDKSAFLNTLDVLCFASQSSFLQKTNQCCNWGNLAHSYAVFQYSIIVEIIICKSSVSLIVSLLIFSLLFITVHDKHNFFQICSSFNMSKNYTDMRMHVWCDFYVIWDISRTGETIHCSNHCHLHHCGQVFTTCKFFSVDFQLLSACLQHRVVPSVLHAAHRVLSMTVNHLHSMFSEKDIWRTFLCWQRDSSPYTFSATPTVHHLHQVLREKDGEICCLFIGRKKINQTISDKWLVKIALYIWSQVIQSIVTWQRYSQFTCVLWQKGVNM